VLHPVGKESKLQGFYVSNHLSQRNLREAPSVAGPGVVAIRAPNSVLIGSFGCCFFFLFPS